MELELPRLNTVKPFDPIRVLPIYKAALEDEWESVEDVFDKDENKLIAIITTWWETPLHIAVGTNRSHKFVERLVDRIIVSLGKDKLRIPNYYGSTPLHYAAMVGNMEATRLLVDKDQDMPHIPNPSGDTPLNLAAFYCQKEVLWYLLGVTKDVNYYDGEEGTTTPYTGVKGADFITLTITAGFYDVATHIVENYPNIVTGLNERGETALQALAAKPNAFPSGNRLSPSQHLIYSCIPVKTNTRAQDKAATARLLMGHFKHACSRLTVGFWSVLQCFVPYIKHMHEIKVRHMQTERLAKLICSAVIKEVDYSIAWDVLGTAMSTAVAYGTHELIEECIRSYPGMVWYNVGGFYVFLAAIKHRQESVYNLVYQMSGHRVFAATDSSNGENALHMAGRLAPPHRLNTVTGAALQMQRELQWFKEIENFVEPSYKEALNNDQKTPRMVFTDEHEKLLKEGQAWMKDASTSCSVVAALIVTVAFAAAFTVPGGNDSEGKPLFLKERIFMIFAMSDAIALFSSSTSVLMFLGILTSRYAEEDFLYALPKRMTIGLFSLLMSLAAMIIAFSATLVLLLRKEIAWISVPLTLLACVPVTLFVLLQFPLLVELVLSTYGPSIFHRQNKGWLH